ncbi:hypothetical protein EIKCOROL_02310 [Eikenella corrodens ATCC 23834]|uniref:Uncharacterized protein n=1 Tax=Eikenella corrodens ATCC 23834 TaxID=546274 RepID=C0DY48_EIKCO|nr:hypothetical protein EIKCOROL_02310 [Eikenella corrodens ATCC 23834]
MAEDTKRLPESISFNAVKMSSARCCEAEISGSLFYGRKQMG